VTTHREPRPAADPDPRQTEGGGRNHLAVIVLAAGGGTRMKSATPKVMHRIAGRSLLHHTIAAVLADQDEVPGTGRATACGLAALPDGWSGTVLVTVGDVPLLSPETVAALVAQHEAAANVATVLTADVPDPTGYGRILRDDAGRVLGVREHRDATPDERTITEVSSGILAFDAAFLSAQLPKLSADNDQGQLYLPDLLAVAVAEGSPTGALRIDDHWQTEGVNDRVQLATLGRVLNERLTHRAMLEGVTIVDPATTWLDVDVQLGVDVRLEPHTQLRGHTSVADGAVVGPDTTLTDCTVGAGASVVRAHADQAEIGPRVSVGPFAYLRPGTRLCDGAKVGTFVETKNAQIGLGAKVPHLSYVGDADIGPGTNIGAGVIFANYDGVDKHHTSVGRDSFVGSDSTLVAPRTIADGAYVAAGSTVVSDVGPGELAVARGRQRNIDGWVERKRSGTKSAAAARAALQDQQAPTATRSEESSA
jgi:bifunctional UDP-N-acetylglucosamine pyrophosphorylase / glucosamine-1-phosphate N-acetyltransferase